MNHRITTIRELYKRYRFHEIPTGRDGVLAFEHRGGYFQNVDIVRLSNEAPAEEVKSELDSMGYSTVIRDFDPSVLESKLFEGFFELTTTKQEILNSYSNYAERVKQAIGCQYEYIPSKIQQLESHPMLDQCLIRHICEELSRPGPLLVIIEAAAGYGKTCTSYELIKEINRQYEQKLPLFAELSRNRQAQIFRYVLLDEINRQFSGVDLDLVQHHIRNGNIPLLIDGFDELIRGKKGAEKEFDDTEPMLETIKDLLRVDAKIILTSRRTALFSGDEFYEWIRASGELFRVQRFVIQEPTIEEWLGNTKIKHLRGSGFDPRDLANPVLLSFLRGQSDAQFPDLCANTDAIVDKYFESLLERERERQHLLMSVENQKDIFRGIANEMVTRSITAESRDFFEAYIKENYEDLLLDVSLDYLAHERPTLDELAQKLTMHALLDRRGNGEGQIGFVNDFAFGTFVGEIVLEYPTEDWIADEQYAEMAIMAYRSRSAATKETLWGKLRFMSDFLEVEKVINADLWLKGALSRDFRDLAINDYEFEDVSFGGDCIVENVVFSHCVFHQCSFQSSGFHASALINCKFYSSTIDQLPANHEELFINCEFVDSPSMETELTLEVAADRADIPDDAFYKQAILERFWPTGKVHFSLKRKIRTLFLGKGPEERNELKQALEDLRKEGIVFLEDGDCAKLNLAKLGEIRNLLGRH